MNLDRPLPRNLTRKICVQEGPDIYCVVERLDFIEGTFEMLDTLLQATIPLVHLIDDFKGPCGER